MDVPPPRGFHFAPFDDEIIDVYLKPKLLGELLPCNLVRETQIYGPNTNPWQLFDPETHPWIRSQITPGKFEKVTYAFVNLTKMTADGKNNGKRDNYIKKAGCGTWGGKTKRTDITDSNGDIIGERRMLTFEINELSDQDLSKVGHWRMHEFHLSGVNANISNPHNTVLCRLTLDSSKNPPVKLKSRSKADSDHPIKPSNQPQETNTSSSTTLVNSGNMHSVDSFVAIPAAVSSDASAVPDWDPAVPATASDASVVPDWDPAVAEFDWDSDVDWLISLLNSDQENWEVEDAGLLGKRRFEEDQIFCGGSKKICIG